MAGEMEHAMDDSSSTQNGGGLQVNILSVTAAGEGAPNGFLWAGEVPADSLPPGGAAADVNVINEALLRYFTRVHVRDAHRLVTARCNLPSLSWGDLIGHQRGVFRFGALGFEPMPGRTVLDTLAISLGEAASRFRTGDPERRGPFMPGAASVEAPTDAQGVGIARLMRAHPATLLTAALADGGSPADLHLILTGPGAHTIHAGVAADGHTWSAQRPAAPAPSEPCPEDRRAGYRQTHAIQHRCFPPQPPRCVLCGRQGAELDHEPCLGHGGE
jgi:hypothetical protein